MCAQMRRRGRAVTPRARVVAARKPLRVLVVGRGVVPVKVGCGGAELAMFQLAKAVGLAGHEVTLVADVVSEDFPTVPELRVVPETTALIRASSVQYPKSLFSGR